MIDAVIRSAVTQERFKQARQEFLRAITAQKNVAAFPDTKALVPESASVEVWLNFFRELVRCACASKASDRSQGQRPTWLVLPQRQWRRGVESPSLLLRADLEVVPFRGRGSELGDLQNWCDDKGPFALRCYTGAGGMGKTRLGLELCRRMDRAGWVSGFINPEPLRTEPTAAARALALATRAPVLLVVDYAESHRSEVLRIIHWGASDAANRVRVLLLARTAGEWWQLAHDDQMAGGVLRSAYAQEPIELGPMAISLQERRELFEHAAAAFARTLGRSAPRRKPRNFKAPYYGKILWLHMAALLAVEGRDVAGEYAILDEVLRRERRFWRRLGKAFEIPAALVPLLGRAVCVFTATDGVADRHDAVEILRRVPGFRDESEAMLERIGALLHECFPGDRWIEPLQPDRLGDRLVELETDRNLSLLDGFIPGS